MAVPGSDSQFIISQEPVPDLYTDSVGFEANVYGFTIHFGQVVAPPPGFEGKMPSRLVARVHMSPQHAKIMAQLFSRHVAEYERQVGEISLPAQLLAELGLRGSND